jgi:hypothetical protein
MPLDLSKAAILPKDSDERYQSAFEIIESVRQQMQDELGLEEYPKPDSQPRPLADIPNIEALQNAELGGLYAHYVAYAQFVGAKLAETEAAYKIATNVLKQIVAEVQSKLFSQEVPKSEIPARVRDNPVYKRFDSELVKLYATKTILAAHHRAYDKQAAALSRIISLRELEFQQTIREGGIKNSARRSRRRLEMPSDFRREAKEETDE